MAVQASLEEVYEKKVLDRLVDKILDGIASAVDKVKPGWRKRNESKITEWKLMFYVLNRSPTGLAGLIIIIGFIIVAILGPFLAPFSYEQQLIYCDPHAELAPPGTIIHIPNNPMCKALGLKPGTFILLLGSDDLGRDLFSRILYGARTSFIVSMLVMLVGPWIGVLLGFIAGYYGGAIDEVIMRITDIFLVFPGLILAMALSAVLPSRISSFLTHHNVIASILLALFAVKPKHLPALTYLVSVIIALWIVWWPGYARLVRGMVLSAKENTYVEAARALGLSPLAIMFKHILPNIMGPLIALLTMDIGGVILTEAALSFLGLGAVPPLADWGRIIYDGAEFFPNAWWLVFFPGLAIFIVVLGFNMFGDTLRDMLDPRTRRSIEFKIKSRKAVKTVEKT